MNFVLFICSFTFAKTSHITSVSCQWTAMIGYALLYIVYFLFQFISNFEIILSSLFNELSGSAGLKE